MSRDWSWWDAWKSGDAEQSQRALDAETDRSLERDSSRWSWGPSVSEVTAEETRRNNRREAADRRHRSGKGDVRGGESDERTTWRDKQWREAKEDYRQQNPDWRDRDRDERDDDGGILW